MTSATGIDVSGDNGTFDWTAHPDIDFAAAKLGEGPHDGEPAFYDPQFTANWAAMKVVYGNKLARFAYWFLHPAADVTGQADALTSITREHGLQDGDGFWLDLEPYPGLATPDGMAAADVARAARQFCARVNRNCPGCRCMVYCDPATARAGCCTGLDKWRLVIADYDVTQPRVPAPWKTWHAWQKSGDTLDRDQWHGTRADLLDFCRMPAARR